MDENLSPNETTAPAEFDLAAFEKNVAKGCPAAGLQVGMDPAKDLLYYNESMIDPLSNFSNGYLVIQQGAVGEQFPLDANNPAHPDSDFDSGPGIRPLSQGETWEDLINNPQGSKVQTHGGTRFKFVTAVDLVNVPGVDMIRSGAVGVWDTVTRMVAFRDRDIVVKLHWVPVFEDQFIMDDLDKWKIEEAF